MSGAGLDWHEVGVERLQAAFGAGELTSLALVGEPAPRDATVVQRLRSAGAVILGKTNLSEWANFRSTRAETGWSARGGLVRNPHVLDRSPAGSSSGSAAAVAAGFAPVSLGTETHASIIGPAHACGVVGLKPTAGLTSRAGVIPVAHSFDSVGVHTRTVTDAARALTVLAGFDPRDPATERAAGHAPAGYREFLRADGLRGARIGVARCWFGAGEKGDRVIEAALQALRAGGAQLVDPVEFPSWPQVLEDQSEFTVMLYEFKAGIDAYLRTRTGVPVGSLADVIAFNEAHADLELRYFGQEIFELAQGMGDLNEPAYREALAATRRLGAGQGIDAVLRTHALDAIVAPAGEPAWVADLINGQIPRFTGPTALAARAGYPMITVPAGEVFGLPIGLVFMAGAYQEPTLIRLAYAFEQLTQARIRPQFRPTLM